LTETRNLEREIERIPRLSDVVTEQENDSYSYNYADHDASKNSRGYACVSVDDLVGKELIVQEVFACGNKTFGGYNYESCFIMAECVQNGEKVYFNTSEWFVRKLLRAIDKLPLRVGIIRTRNGVSLR
jgi:hypothetical protein